MEHFNVTILQLREIFANVSVQLQRGFTHREKLASSSIHGVENPDSLFVLEETSQVQGLHTFIR